MSPSNSDIDPLVGLTVFCSPDGVYETRRVGIGGIQRFVSCQWLVW